MPTRRVGCLLPSKTNFERFLVYSKGRYILGPLAILIGIPLAIFSVKIYTMATFIMTALFVCVLVTCGVYAIPVTFAPWVGYPVVIVAILAGLVVSFLLRIKAPSLPKFCVGGVAGMVATLWLSIAVLAYLHSVVFYIAAPVLIIIGAIAAKLKSNTTFLVSTAATGSCLFVHGVSAFIGGYWHDIEFYREHTAKTTGDNVVSLVTLIGLLLDDIRLLRPIPRDSGRKCVPAEEADAAEYRRGARSFLRGQHRSHRQASAGRPSLPREDHRSLITRHSISITADAHGVI